MFKMLVAFGAVLICWLSIARMANGQLKAAGDGFLRFGNSMLNPCTNFYGYACSRYSEFKTLDDLAREETHEDLKSKFATGLIKQDATPMGKLAKFYKTCTANYVAKVQSDDNAGTDEGNARKRRQAPPIPYPFNVAYHNARRRVRETAADAQPSQEDYYTMCLKTYSKLSSKPEVSIIRKHSCPMVKRPFQGFSMEKIALMEAQYGIPILFNASITVDGLSSSNSQRSTAKAIKLQAAIGDTPAWLHGTPPAKALGNIIDTTFLDPKFTVMRQHWSHLLASMQSENVPHLTTYFKEIRAFTEKLENVVQKKWNLNKNNKYISMTIGQFKDWLKERIPEHNVDWVEYFNIMLGDVIVVDSQSMIVMETLKDQYAILHAVDVMSEQANINYDVVWNYAITKLVYWMARDSENKIVDKLASQFGSDIVRSGAAQSDYCIDLIMDKNELPGLSLALLSYYNNKNFKLSSKLEKAAGIFSDIKLQYKALFRNSGWIDPAQYCAIAAKADNIDGQIGLPAFLRQNQGLETLFGELRLTDEDHYENMRRVRVFRKKVQYLFYKNQGNTHLTWATPAESSPVYHMVENSLDYPIGRVYSDMEGSKTAKHYGWFGYGVASAVSRGFNARGLTFLDYKKNYAVVEDKNFNNKFRNMSICLKTEYNNALQRNPNQVLELEEYEEYLSHSLGVRVAYKAFMAHIKKSLKYQFKSKTSMAKEFFTAFAVRFCAPADASDKKEYLVNIPLRNMPEFLTTFACPTRPETELCRVYTG